ncbi:metallophosphoesterase [Candidatus Woesearchaeota archaeon]|nr:metallophosphoesterase [Candidatus Woesearchaeota archaeon]
MDILPNIKIIGLALYLEKQKILVIADTHIGYEEALNKQGILIPRLQYNEVIKQLELVFKEVKPKVIVLLGDIKHEFGTISSQEWNDTMKLLDFLILKSGKVVLIKGNHDTILGPLARRKGLEVKERFAVDGVLFCHGHKLVDEKSEAYKKSKTIIIGHEHPAISLRDDVRTEKFKCFLLGKYKRKNLVVMPSFSFVTEGTDVLQEKLLSPFISNIHDFEAFVVGDKIYKFGKIKELGEKH